MSDMVASGNVNTGASEGSGRIVVITEPALPATCVICARNANGSTRFIDFNVSLDWYGSVNICEDCMKEALGVLGYIPKTHLDLALDANEVLNNRLEVANSELDKYRSIVDGLSSVRPDLNPVSVDNVVGSEDIEGPVGEVESPDSERLETESDPDGPDSSGGLKDLSIFAD